jgi:hypothetical protein
MNQKSSFREGPQFVSGALMANKQPTESSQNKGHPIDGRHG